MKTFLVLMFAFVIGSVNAQTPNCGPNAEYLVASCTQGCYSVVISIGLNNFYFSPTKAQGDAIVADLNRRCASFSESARIDEPGTI